MSTVPIHQSGPAVYAVSGTSSRPIPLSFKLFAISIGFGVFSTVADAYGWAGTSYNSLRDYIFVSVGPLFAWMSVFVGLSEGKLNDMKRFFVSWVFWVGTLIVFLFIYGVLIQNEFRLIGQDVLLFSYFFAGLILGTRIDNWVTFDKLLTVIFLMGSVFTILSWLSLGFVPENRQSVQWTVPFWIWGGMLFAWPYFLLTIDRGSIFRRIVAVSGIATFLVVAILVEKRAPIVQLGLLLVLSAYAFRNGSFSVQIRRASKSILVCLFLIVAGWGILAVLGSGSYFRQASTSLFERFTDKGNVYDSFMSNPRIQLEPQYVLDQLDDHELIFGRGLGGAVDLPSGIWGKRSGGLLHNGMASIALKGGLVFLVIWSIGWLAFIVMFVKNKDPGLNVYYLPLLIVLLPSFVIGFLALHPSLGFVMMCAGRCMSTWRPESTGVAEALPADSVPVRGGTRRAS